MKRILILLAFLPTVLNAQPYPSNQGNPQQLIRQQTGYEFKTYVKVPILDSGSWYPGYTSDIWRRKSDSALMIFNPVTGKSNDLDSLFVTPTQLMDSINAIVVPSLQQVTTGAGNNTTTNALHLTGNGNINASLNSLLLSYTSLGALIKFNKPGAYNGGIVFSGLDGSTAFTTSNSSGAATYTPLILFANATGSGALSGLFNGRVQGAVGITADDYVTVKQLSDSIALGTSSYIPLSQKGATDGVASLVGGKVPNSQLPALVITETFVVISQDSMLALSAAEQGDIAVRTDISKSFILVSGLPSVLGNWQELLSPTVQNTDQVPEGSTNLYFQTDRARNSVSASGDITYNPATGVFSYTTPPRVTSVSGTDNRITSTGGLTPVIDIASNYAGQSSITTLGTIGTGVWNGTTITKVDSNLFQTRHMSDTTRNNAYATFIQLSEKGATNGVATLVSGTIPSNQLPPVTPAGSTTQIQYNNLGALAASPAFAFSNPSAGTYRLQLGNNDPSYIAQLTGGGVNGSFLIQSGGSALTLFGKDIEYRSGFLGGHKIYTQNSTLRQSIDVDGTTRFYQPVYGFPATADSQYVTLKQATDLDAASVVGGLYDANGDGSTTDFTVFHDVTGDYLPIISPYGPAVAGPYYIAISTPLQFTVRFLTAPPVGSNNVSFRYIIKKL